MQATRKQIAAKHQVSSRIRRSQTSLKVGRDTLDITEMLLGPWHVESLQCTRLHLAMMAMKTDKGKMKMHSAGAKGAETWVSDVALRRSRGRVALRRCDAATLPGAGGAATLRRCRRCWRCDAATRDPRCDAVGATLRRCDARATLRRCWRCDASFCKSAHSVASRLDTLDVYST